MKFRHSLLLTCLALCCLPLAGANAESAKLSEQRRLFIESYARAELGDWRTAALNNGILNDYVLWPDLRAAWLITRVRNRDYTGVDDFLNQYGTLKPARDLRYRYAIALAEAGEHEAYLAIYRRFYQALRIADLDCLAMRAEISAGRGDQITARATELWLTGRNQVSQCDPVFDHLRAEKKLDVDLYQQRFELAIDAREFAIARYLAASLGTDYRERSKIWTGAAGDPEAFLIQHNQSKETDEYRQQLAYAAQQLAYREPELASELWISVADRYAFASELKNATDRHIALWAARRHRPVAASLLATVDPAAKDAEILRWQARNALLNLEWTAVLESIESMRAADRESEEWQYWLAKARKAAGQVGDHQQILTTLAKERSYYGFLAADDLKLKYNIANEPLLPDELVIEALLQHPDIVRALELFAVGLEGRGRSEWDAAVAMLSSDEKLQASILAHRSGWHSQAIATAAGEGHLDDIDLRYPMPYRSEFEKYSRSARISNSWAYGISRSESLFMRDVRSSAGAIGLMQLLPETGRRTAMEMNLPYNGMETLTDPESNIRLGVAYLGKMLQRFDDNSVLATAAYNAGPLNVEQWLPKQGSVDTRIWIENIPYNETRAYVRRVLLTETIFDWRLRGKWQRLGPRLSTVSAPVEKIATSAN